MLWITFTHLGEYWDDNSWRVIWRTVFVTMDWVGPTIFISLSVIGTTISIMKRKCLGKTKGMMIPALKKSSYLFFIGTVLNLMIELLYGHGLGAWLFIGMNMITAVAFAQLLTYGLVQLKTMHKLVLLLMLIIIFPLLFNYSLTGIDYDGNGEISPTMSNLTSLPMILYYVLFHMASMISTFSWVICAVLTSLVFQDFIKFHVKAAFLQGTSEMVDKDLHGWRKYYWRRLVLLGIICILFTILYGGFMTFPGISFTRGVYEDLSRPGGLFQLLNLDGVPLFFYRHTPHYVLYNFGIFSIAFGLFYYIKDFKNKRFFGWDLTSKFGRYSFPIFIYSHGFALIPLRLSFLPFMVIFIPLLVGLLYFVRYWDKRWDGKLSLEWALGKYLYLLARINSSINKSKKQNK